MAGKPASSEQLINVAKLVADYYSKSPSPEIKEQAVSFGTSGHRGTSSLVSFNDGHIEAICQALAEYRIEQGINGPIFIGKDTHALSEPALITAIEVLSANGAKVVVQENNEYTPTPVISHRILTHNKANANEIGDGIVITPSHNPPSDGGFKYNPPHGGPAGSEITNWIQDRANQIIANDYQEVKRVTIDDAYAAGKVSEVDFAQHYIEDLEQVIDMKAIAKANIKLGTDPLGGSGLHYWEKIAKHYKLDITVVNKEVDQRFAFMRCDKDGKIRMDCSSASAMAGLIEMKDKFDLAFGNDPDFDRHGIVTSTSGLMNPNHYLAVAINYLYQHRPEWDPNLKIGKTLVSSSMIDRVAKSLDRELLEMPVGFKWFVDGLNSGEIGFAGEESAGGIFLRRDGSPWATDKDGFIMCLLAAELTAVTGKNPAEHYQLLTEKFGEPQYTRIDVAASLDEKQKLSAMDADVVKAKRLADEEIESIQTSASGNNAKIGGVKVSTQNGWFAARPSGTENVYKIYAESFKGESHLQKLVNEAESLVSEVLKKPDM